MAFTSINFLALFLPLFLANYFLVPRSLRNWVILVWSFGFYWAGAGDFTVWLVLLIVSNYFAGMAIDRTSGMWRKIWLALAIVGGVTLLFVYKYAAFAIDSLNHGLIAVGWRPLPLVHYALPLGISFFTFQGIAYLIDIYRGKHRPARNLIDFAVFKVCFPQLVAGPIVRFDQVADSLHIKRESLEKIYSGLSRLGLGLFRKLVLADTLGAVADNIFGMPVAERSAPMAWLGLICYTLQIYHDFGGYSDMAIGMGRIMGFDYPENFNQPYRARSITEFWRRWHQSLSTWFRDYLYIPLGGNRHGPFRTYFNLGLVFLLCGLWHGANWTFVIWGGYHGLLLIMERALGRHSERSFPAIMAWGYTFLATMIGWVFFRAESISQAFDYFETLLPHAHGKEFFTAAYYLTHDRAFFLLVALATALLPLERLDRWARWQERTITRGVIGGLGYAYSFAILTTNGFNPFIYFRF